MSEQSAYLSQPSRSVNVPIALRAAVAGGIAVSLFLLSMFINAYTSFSGGGFLFTTWRFENMSLVALLVWFLIIPSLLAVGGALPARALGIGGLRSLLPPAIALNALYVITLWLIIKSYSGALILATLAVGLSISAFIVVLVAEAIRDGTGRITASGAAAFLAISTLGLSTREAFFAAFLFGLSAWVILPAIAGLFQPRTDESENQTP